MQRGGFPFRTVILALFVVGTVYLLYLYNTTLGRLRDAELTAERYRREEETKTAQLQGVIRSKDELQEKCDNDKREFTNRLNSLNQQHKMLKSQYDEHEVEQMRLEQETRRLREEFEQVEQQRNQEYQQLKAEKELEIANFKDQVANFHRQNEQLQNQIASLRSQLQNGEEQLAVKNAQLMQQGQGQGLGHGQALVQGQGQIQGQQQPMGQGGFGANKQFGFDAGQQQQFLHHQQLNHQQQMFGQGMGQQGGVANMNIDGAGGNNLGVQHQGLNLGNVQGGLDPQQQQEAIDKDNQLHQVVPPNGHPVVDAPVNENVDGHQPQQQAEVKDEDHQVQPPNLNADAAIKDTSREGAGVGAGAMAGVGARRGDQQHDGPVPLRQIVQPHLGEQHGVEREEEDHNNVLQQVPPVGNVNFGRHEAAADKRQDVRPVAPQGGF